MMKRVLCYPILISVLLVLFLFTNDVMAVSGSLEPVATLTQSAEVGSSPPSLDHCVTSPDRPFHCYFSQAEALFWASDGKLRLDPDQIAADLSPPELSNSGIQAILYEHTNHTGASLTVTSSGCYGWNNLPSHWNDRITSAQTTSCGITLYEHYNKTGPTLTISAPGTNYVGAAMNDKASSWSLP